MLALRIRIASARLIIYSLARLSFLPSLLKNKLAQYSCNQIEDITKEMHRRKLI